jgi:hypothetical protein
VSYPTVTDHKQKSRKPIDADGQLVFRFADNMRIENEALRTEVASLRSEVKRLQGMVDEVAAVMRFYALELAQPSENQPPRAP